MFVGDLLVAALCYLWLVADFCNIRLFNRLDNFLAFWLTLTLTAVVTLMLPRLVILVMTAVV